MSKSVRDAVVDVLRDFDEVKQIGAIADRVTEELGKFLVAVDPGGCAPPVYVPAMPAPSHTTLTHEQVDAIDRLDSALCNFLNGASDQYDPRLWIPETKRNFAALCDAYNQCHIMKVMDLRRAADTTALGITADTPLVQLHVRTYQERVAEAHHALFADDPTDIEERRDRYAEESNEVLQAFGMSREDMHKLVDYTWGRPVGEHDKEIGAALVTLTSLCVVAGVDLMSCGEAELEKLQRPETIARIRAKRSTRHGRGPLPGVDPALATEGKDNG
jgi:hypothetical protein